VNAANHHANAWARLERSDITVDEFDAAFAAESEQLGHRVSGADVLALLEGEIRPEMVDLLDRVNAAGFRTACLTNNITRSGTSARDAAVSDVMRRFELVVESSKVGVRKPEPRFYEVACELLGVEPAACLFLDDLGINLKPAAAMGMRTIKVTDPAAAIAEVERLLSL
jgi:putative hydrolase of the HAD superfamily